MTNGLRCLGQILFKVIKKNTSLSFFLSLDSNSLRLDLAIESSWTLHWPLLTRFENLCFCGFIHHTNYSTSSHWYWCEILRYTNAQWRILLYRRWREFLILCNRYEFLVCYQNMLNAWEARSTLVIKGGKESPLKT